MQNELIGITVSVCSPKVQLKILTFCIQPNLISKGTSMVHFDYKKITIGDDSVKSFIVKQTLTVLGNDILVKKPI